MNDKRTAVTARTRNTALAESGRPRRVLIIEAQPVTRYGIELLIDSAPDLEQAGQAGDQRAALQLLGTSNPDAVILDIQLGQDNGLELLKQIVARRAGLAVLVYSQLDEALFAARALRAGAFGYVMKDATPDALLGAVRSVLDGDIAVSKAVGTAAIRRAARRLPGESQDPLSKLTDRELQVLILMGDGHDAHAIAERLFISVHTVHAHREHIKTKLEFDRGKDLLRFAFEFVSSNAQQRPRVPARHEVEPAPAFA